MPAPNFVLSPCTPADVPGMVEVYLSAFENDNFALYCLPRDKITPEEMDRWLNARFLKHLHYPEMRTFKITDLNNDNRQVAFARWQFPYRFSEQEKRVKAEEKKEKEWKKREQGIDDNWPEGANMEIVDLKFGPLNSCREKTIDEETTYVCHLLAVHQDYWRRGLATMLLKHGLDMADSEGRQAWIEATPSGRPVYAKLGFKEVNLVEVDLSRWGGEEPGRNWGMLRESQQKASS